MRFIKPLDEATILHLAAIDGMAFITSEEGVLAGGFGAAVLELLSANGLSNPVARLGLPDRFIEHGDVAAQYAACGLDRAGMIAAARRFCPTDGATTLGPEARH